MFIFVNLVITNPVHQSGIGDTEIWFWCQKIVAMLETNLSLWMATATWEHALWIESTRSRASASHLLYPFWHSKLIDFPALLSNSSYVEWGFSTCKLKVDLWHSNARCPKGQGTPIPKPEYLPCHEVGFIQSNSTRTWRNRREVQMNSNFHFPVSSEIRWLTYPFGISRYLRNLENTIADLKSFSSEI